MYIFNEMQPGGFYLAPYNSTIPGEVIFPEEFLQEFYKEGKLVHGFVDLTVENGYVTGCTWNEEAYQAYLAEHPEVESPPKPEPTPEERLAALERENKALQSQLAASIQSNQMLEDCLVEMAGIVYA